MSGDRIPPFAELVPLVKLRGREISDRYRVEILRHVVDPVLQKALLEVSSYWRNDFRVALTSIACEAVGGNAADTYTISLALSLMGSGIGIHDDVIDRSTFKRYRKTIPGIYDSDIAIVVADMLIVKGLVMLGDTICDTDTRHRVLEAYEQNFLEMCDGESRDIEIKRSLDVGVEDYHSILRKLGVDTEACMRIGAIIGRGSAEQIECLSAYGRRIGYMNRLVDEIKDTFNVEGGLSSRIKNESIPLPLLMVSKRSPVAYQRIKALVGKEHLSADELTEFFDFFRSGEEFSSVRDIIANTTKETLDGLSLLPDSDAKKNLKTIACRYLEEIGYLLD
jgi:geranylgeranyl pyrophosphate synthase